MSEETNHSDGDKPAVPSNPLFGVWMPIESAPLDGTNFLGWEDGSFWVAWYGWDGNDGKPVFYNGDVSVDITHWMPLPNPPNEELTLRNGAKRGQRRLARVFKTYKRLLRMESHIVNQRRQGSFGVLAHSDPLAIKYQQRVAWRKEVIEAHFEGRTPNQYAKTWYRHNPTGQTVPHESARKD